MVVGEVEGEENGRENTLLAVSQIPVELPVFVAGVLLTALAQPTTPTKRHQFG